jgi:CHAD domain-containing protein
MAEAEQALTTEVHSSSPEKPEKPQPRQLTEIIPSQLEILRVYHRGVLETEDVEAVHKMRVTTRRLQASLDLLEREMKVRKLKRRLRKWRRALSRVRNYDVFLQLIGKEAAGRRKAHREQFELVKALLQERRVRKATKVRKLLEGIDLDQMALKLGLSTSLSIEAPESNETEEQSEELSQTPGTLSVDESKVAGYAAERLDQRLAEFQALVAQSHPTTDPSELHELRIAAKRMRYLLEIVSEMGYGDASRALAWLRTLQDRIGDWHDLEGLEEEIFVIVSNREFMKQHLAESSTMLQAAAHLQKKKEALVAKLFPVRVPKMLETTSRRIARALRRESIREQTS